MGDKQYRGTLFFSYITQAILSVCNVGGKECTPALFVGGKECTPALFVPHWLSLIGSKECTPTLSIACVI